MTVANYTGDPQDPTDDTPFDALKEKSLKAAGYSYLIGDAALFVGGLTGGRYKEAFSGAAWGLGGLAAARYGNPNAEKQLNLLSRHLGDYLRNQNIEIPHEPTTEKLAKKGGVIDRIEDFLYTYPSQMLNFTYLVGSGTLIHSGIQHDKKWDRRAGALIAAGALSGLLINEKEPNPDHPPATMLGRAMSWIQEKPLRLSGAFYWANNAAVIMSGLEHQKANPGGNNHWFRYITAASYIFANGMLALSSSKANHNQDGGREALAQLSDAAAHVIAARPQEEQTALVQQISGFLAADAHVKMKAVEIEALLKDRLAQTKLQAKGWADRSQQQQAAPGFQL